MHHIPIAAAHHGHLADGEILVQPVHAGGGAGAPAYGNARRGLAPEGLIVRELVPGIEDPVQKRAQGAVWRGVVDGGADDDAVGRDHGVRQFVGLVVIEDASSRLRTALTVDAAPDRRVGQLEPFHIQTLLLNALLHQGEGGGCGPVLVGTSVD